MSRGAGRAIAARKSKSVKFSTCIVPPKLRRGLLLGASGLTVAIALGGAREAAALNECGPAAGAPPSVTCKASGNPYPNGIEYQVDDLTIVVKNGVTIDTTLVAGETGGIVSGHRFPDTGIVSGDLVISVSAGTLISTDDKYADGIVAGTGDPGGGTGSVTITSAANISTTGDWANAIEGHAYGGDIEVVVRGTLSTTGQNADAILISSNLTNNHILSIDSRATITTTGDRGIGVRGYSHGADSAVAVTSTGKITTSGQYGHGILAATTGDNSAVAVVSTGKITTSGDEAIGIGAGTAGAGSNAIIVSTAGISTIGAEAAGIFGITAGDDSDLTIVSMGAVSTTDGQSDGIHGATAGTDADISIVSTAGITTLGHESDGIEADVLGLDGTLGIISTGGIATAGGESDGIDGSGIGNVTILSTGPITTKGPESDGIEATSTTGNVQATSTGAISTSGTDADGIHVLAGEGNIKITSAGTISTIGGGSNGSEGIWAKAPEGAITIANGSTTTTTGEASDAIHAESADAIAITTRNASASGLNADGVDATSSLGAVGITVTGAVSGGWMGGHGIAIDAGAAPTVTINAGGSVGALNDLALQESGQDLTLANKGTITGVLVTGAGADTVTNAGTWQLRAFRDTDGDGTRNSESVARVDFGFDFDTVNNTGTLVLSDVSGATSVNNAGEVVDPFGTDGDITLAGVEQGQLLGLERFINSGSITMQDGTVGDLLAITDQSGVGAGGGADFVSNGGSLKLDVYLDDGSSGKSDMLFLDNASTGAGGATRVFVNNTGGPGALTLGDGIQVINVDGTSSSNAFTLGAPVVAGAFQYDLEYQNAAGTDQSWYLRSSPFAGALAYPSVSASALTTWRSDLAAFTRRLESLRLNMTAPAVTVPAMAGIAESGSITLDPVRFTGGWFSMTESDDSVSQSGIAGFSQDTARAEMGFDFALDNVSGSDDWLVIGAFGGQGWSQADFSDADASTDFDIAAMGVYASYFRGPYHMDALVKFDWLDGEYRSDSISGGGDVHLPVFGVSLSTGYQFDLTSGETGGLSLQPVAALDYAHVGGDTFRDNSGATIDLMEMDSVRGRLGARLVQQLLPDEDGAGPVGNLYFSAGVAQEFLGQAEARVTGVNLTQELPQTTFELGAGFDLALPEEGVSLTFDTSADFSEGEDNYAATGGVKFTW